MYNLLECSKNYRKTTGTIKNTVKITEKRQDVCGIITDMNQIVV